MSDECPFEFSSENVNKLREALSACSMEELERIGKMSSKEFKEWKKEHGVKVYSDDQKTLKINNQKKNSINYNLY